MRRLPVPGIGTRLALMVLVMMALTLGAHFLIETHYEKVVVDLVQNQTEDLSKALEISVQQMTSKGQTDQELLQDYVTRLSAEGVSEISILSSEWRVVASSNQAKVGTRVRPPRRAPKGPLVISGTLGEDDEDVDTKSAFNLDIPIIVDDQKKGYVHLHVILDDFEALLRSVHRKRSLATSLVFLAGVGASLTLAHHLTSPLKRLSDAAERVSTGDLEVQVKVERGDEIGKLQKSFRRMLEKLRETRKLETELRRSERAGALGRLAAAVAHEIRNPLNFMSLSVDHLRAALRSGPGASTEETDRALLSIKEELHRVNSMVADFLSYGRPPRLRISSCQLPEVLQDVRRVAALRAAQQKVTLDLRVSDSLPPIQADPEGIRTCLLNLVNNGIQAMPLGGHLEIDAAPGEKGMVQITVTDEGVGIPARDLDRIFDPYFSNKEAGVGLGLAITQRIVQDHQGRVEVSSVEKEGTEFRVYLPVDGPHPSRADLPEPRLAKGGAA
jgi:signal transduction histidine kinase